MRISKNRVLDFLTKCQIEKGGYAGGDVAELAKNLPVSPQALRKRINFWITNDPAFKQLRYLGKQFVHLTTDDFVLINQRLKEKPLGRMSVEKMTDGIFEMEYEELTFLIRLYGAIGFLGRNLIFSDSPAFYRLQYFIQRYLSDATLDLEFKHLWKVYE